MSKLKFNSNSTLKDIQQYVREMEEERGFTKKTVAQDLLLLIEEVGELAKAVRKSHAGMETDVNRKYNENAGEEIADIILVLTAIANRLDVDMAQSIWDKEEYNKKRKWA